MNISISHIRPFPAYEDVFEGDVERYRQHFLPILSVNLQCLFPGEDQWLHFVSVKEIYDGSVGEETESEHRQFTKEDMLGFDVVNGKYRFEADLVIRPRCRSCARLSFAWSILELRLK